jgi:hypothetical protein
MQAALTEIQRIPTSGARAVAAFTVAGRQLLAIPQLARDAPGSPPGMNGGGTPADPHPVLDSQIYAWDGAALRVAAEFPTCGGTDVAVLRRAGGGIELVVSNSLTPQLRFAAETVRYSLSLPPC